MTKITKDDVLRVAQLAHLDLSEGEVESITRQLDSILNYADKLNQLDTEGVEPMSHVAPPRASEPGDAPGDSDGVLGSAAPLSTPLREDTVVACTIIGEVLAGAPDPDPPYFRVPKVIDR